MPASRRIPQALIYPGKTRDCNYVSVERLTAQTVTEALAVSMLSAVQESYTAQLGDHQVPASVIKAAYSADRAGEYYESLIQCLNKGDAQYWLAFQRGDRSNVLGLSQIIAWDDRVTYIADIIARPPWHNGVGSRLLHAPLAHGGYSARNGLFLHGFVGSGVNAWYERLGFEPGPLDGHYPIGTDHNLLLRQYVTPATVALQGVVGRLESRTPALCEVQIQFAPGY